MLLFHGDADEVVAPSNLLEVKDFLERNKIKVDVNMIKNCVLIYPSKHLVQH